MAKVQTKAQAQCGMYAYVVACIGARVTERVTITLRRPGLFDAAKAIARQRIPGRLAYSVETVNREQ